MRRISHPQAISLVLILFIFIFTFKNVHANNENQDFSGNKSETNIESPNIDLWLNGIPKESRIISVNGQNKTTTNDEEVYSTSLKNLEAIQAQIVPIDPIDFKKILISHEDILNINLEDTTTVLTKDSKTGLLTPTTISILTALLSYNQPTICGQRTVVAYISKFNVLVSFDSLVSTDSTSNSTSKGMIDCPFFRWKDSCNSNKDCSLTEITDKIPYGFELINPDEHPGVYKNKSNTKYSSDATLRFHHYEDSDRPRGNTKIWWTFDYTGKCKSDWFLCTCQN